MDKPLSGVKVVELADYVSAPVCCRLLADMGAEVIKVERNTGNVWRSTGLTYCPDRFTLEENPVYDIYNTGKKHIVLDVKKAEGVSVLKRLLEQADVFVTNLRPAALKRLGLTYEELKEQYPQLIYAIGLGYGENGPDAEKPAFDTSAFWARTGFLRDLGTAGEHYQPVCPPSAMGDTITGITLAGEVCAALLSRQKNGRGECVKASLFHNAIFAMGTMQIWSQPSFGGTFPKTRAEHGLPNGYYKCRDGEYIFIATGYAPQTIPGVLKMIEREDLQSDERFASEQARAENAEEFYRILQHHFLQRTVDEWLDLAKNYDVPVSRMQHFADLAKDEQAWANGYVENVAFPSGHVDVMPTSPIEMESIGELKTVPSHRIGEDTEQQLKQLGYSESEIIKLRETGVIN